MADEMEGTIHSATTTLSLELTGILKKMMKISARIIEISRVLLFSAFQKYSRILSKMIFCRIKSAHNVVRFEVFTAVTMKNGVFWDVTPCGSCKNRRFGGT
jgi:hypothetical protein